MFTLIEPVLADRFLINLSMRLSQKPTIKYLPVRTVRREELKFNYAFLPAYRSYRQWIASETA